MVPENSEFESTKVEFTCLPAAYLQSCNTVLTRAFQVSCQGDWAQGQPPFPQEPCLDQSCQRGIYCSSTHWKALLSLPIGQNLSLCCDFVIVKSVLHIKKNRLIKPKINIRVLFGFSPHPKGHVSTRKIWAENSVRAWLTRTDAFSCQGNSAITGVQHVSKEIIAAPQLTQQVSGLLLHLLLAKKLRECLPRGGQSCLSFGVNIARRLGRLNQLCQDSSF